MKNYDIQRAVDAIGGPTKLSNILGVSNAAIHAWVRKGRVPDLDMATLMAEKSGIALELIRPPKPPKVYPA